MKRWLFSAAAAAVAAAGSTRAADPATAPATVTVTVPVGAALTVNGQRTAQMTAVRYFVSPPLPAGQSFSYTFQTSYTQNGKTVSRARTVGVSAGATVLVDLLAAPEVTPPPTASAPAEPYPLPNQFDIPKKKSSPPDRDTEPAPKTETKKKPAPPPAPVPEEPKSPDQEEPAKKPPAAAVPPEKKSPQPGKPAIEVPYVPTPEKVVSEMLKLAGVKSGDVVYDLGCGDGRITIAAVKDFHAQKGLGIDYNPKRVEESKAAAQKAGGDVAKSVEFKEGDVLKLTPKDFEGVDVVTLYLLPEVNDKLKPVLRKGLKPGARVVSHDFDMGDWKPEKTETVKDDEGTDHTIYLWTIPPGK